jgi:hypothetical protein
MWRCDVIVVFTLCSANYLAHARTLADSVVKHNETYKIVIGLVDRLPASVESSFCDPYELIPVEDLPITALPEMVERYNIVELNTAVKPFYMEYLYNRDPQVEAVIYLDPDILVLSDFKTIVKRLTTYDIIVTPHSCTYDDSALNIHYELTMLSTGIFNLGFLATRRSETTFAFLTWWQKRLQDHCYYWPGSGVFVDQLWVTLAPLYFAGIFVEKNPGFNMCYWNHFERQLTIRDGRYIVNGDHELVFHHFSSYDPEQPNLITKRIGVRALSFKERPDLKPLFDKYRAQLLAHGYLLVRPLEYSLRNLPKESRTPKAAVRDSARGLLRALPTVLQMPLRRIARFTINTFE